MSVLAVVVVLAGFVSGCRREPAYPEGRPAPSPSAPARYGMLSAGVSTNAATYEAAGSLDTNWVRSPFFVVESALTPGLWIHSELRYLGLFGGMGAHGLGAPTRVAWSTREGPRAFKAGDSLDVSRLEENWVLVWFAGARGWTNWDSPWAVFLQHPPASMKLDGEGLHFTFTNRAGDVVAMPLYGGFKPAVAGRDLMEQNGMPSRKVSVRTGEWEKALPRDPLVRLRFWAGASRRYPMMMAESIRVEGALDAVKVRTRVSWQELGDAWGTKPLKVAPVSPGLGLALRDPQFPARFTERPFDLEIFTSRGPLHGVMNADSYEVAFPVLQYAHETRAWTNEAGGAVTAPGTAAARERFQNAARQLMAAGLADAARPGGVDWRGAALLARGLGDLGPDLRRDAQALLRRALEAELVRAERGGLASLADAGVDGARWDRFVVASCLMDAAGGGGATGGAATGEGAWVRAAWPLLKRWIPSGIEHDWAAYGRDPDGDVALGQALAGMGAVVRMAYRVGDADAYALGCAAYAREWVRLWGRVRGADYFRHHQPYGSMEYLDEDVMLTRLNGESGGWQLDGGRYPVGVPVDSRRFHERWSRMEDGDVARVFRDYLRGEPWRELLRRGAVGPENAPGPETASGSGRSGDGAGSAPGTLRLEREKDPVKRTAWVAPRVWALGESPERVLGDWAPASWSGSATEVMAASWAAMRGGGPERYERLVPGAVATEWVAGLDRWPGPTRSSLVTAIRAGDAVGAKGPLRWPEPVWPEWRTGTGAAWSFGQIRPVRSGGPRAMREIPLNATTRVLVYDLP